MATAAVPVAAVPLSQRSAWEYVFAIALSAPFLWSVTVKMSNFSAATDEVRQLTGLPFAELIALGVILLQLLGSILLLTRATSAVAGAVALAAFTAAATLLAHPFWLSPPGEMVTQANIFWEHVAIIGGLLLLADRERRRTLPGSQPT